MPRDGQGIMSKPPGTAATPNETITSAQFNTTVDDIVADLNAPRPISAGGTGGTSAETARDGLQVARKADSVSDFTTGRGLIIGSGGLLGNAVAHGVSNANDLVTGHNWNISTTVGITNLPTTQPGILTVEARAANRFVQEYRTTPTGNRAWQRTYDGSVWTPWAEFFTQASVLGAVTQADGVPTGALAQIGENANGKYRRMFDGTMRCARFVTVNLNTDGLQTFSLPANFVFGSWRCAGLMPDSLTATGWPARVAALRMAGVRVSETQWQVRIPPGATVVDAADVWLWAEGEWF